MRKRKDYRFETKQQHVGQENADKATGARAVPIYATTAYVFENCEQAQARFALKEAGNIYSRITNPTVEVFEKRMAALEDGAAAVAFASGAAAITAVFQNIAGANSHIVSACNIYGGTYNLLANTLPDFGIITTFVNQNSCEEFENAITENTKAIFVEILGNPNSSVVDIEEIAKIAHAHKIPLIVDNTFATPYLCKPINFGADIVIHSATKFIGGYGTVLGGVVIDAGRFKWEEGNFPLLNEPSLAYHGLTFSKDIGALAFITRLRTVLLRDTGAALSAFDAFIFLQGLQSLSLRVERHVQNSLQIVNFLQKHSNVEKVNHPSLQNSEQNLLYAKYFPKGAGSIFTFEFAGDEKQTKKMIDKLKLFSLLASVADSKSLVIHPGSTTHSQMSKQQLKESGIKPNTVRLSVGLEHIDDLIEDLYEALEM